MIPRANSGVRLLGLLLLGGLVHAASDTPALWALLERMTRALAEREYEGTLIYLRGSHLGTVRVAHRLAAGQWRDSLLALSGPPRLITRDEQEVSCVFTDEIPLRVERPLLPVLEPTLDRQALATHYLLRSAAVARVSGRETEGIALLARDRFRYSYRFAVDRLTAVPLKVEVLDGDREPIGQALFAEVEVFAAAAAPPVAASPRRAALDPATSRWRVVDPPPGFALRVYDRRENAPEGAMEHFLFSDGLATVSLYIEPRADLAALNGVLRLGTVHVAASRIADHQVIAVGEVPAATVVSLSRAVRPVAAAAGVSR